MATKQLMTITPAAVERVKALLAKAPAPAAGLRLSVETKGCTGLRYKVDYANAHSAGDEVVGAGGVQLFIDPMAVMYVAGTEMDYVESAVKSGFEFKNPNESGRCGCGESFYVDREKLAEAFNGDQTA